VKGDSLKYQLGMKFTTKDRDNDKYNYGNCAEKEKGIGLMRNSLDLTSFFYTYFVIFYT